MVQDPLGPMNTRYDQYFWDHRNPAVGEYWLSQVAMGPYGLGAPGGGYRRPARCASCELCLHLFNRPRARVQA